MQQVQDSTAVPAIHCKSSYRPKCHRNSEASPGRYCGFSIPIRQPLGGGGTIGLLLLVDVLMMRGA